MRDEVLITYTDSDGQKHEAYRVGESFAVREASKDEQFIGVNPDPRLRFVATHFVIYLQDACAIPMPNEEFAWFFADQLAIHADGLDPDALDKFMKESRGWAEHTYITGEMIPYHHYKRQKQEEAI